MADETRTPGPMGGLRGKGSKKKKKLLSADEFFKIKDSKQEFTGPKSTKGSLGDSVNRFRKMDDEINKQQELSKGGRAGYKMGSKCKLATKGKGRAYGKNS
jgi:hypothetical protein